MTWKRSSESCGKPTRDGTLRQGRYGDRNVRKKTKDRKQTQAHDTKVKKGVYRIKVLSFMWRIVLCEIESFIITRLSAYKLRHVIMKTQWLLRLISWYWMFTHVPRCVSLLRSLVAVIKCCILQVWQQLEGCLLMSTIKRDFRQKVQDYFCCWLMFIFQCKNNTAKQTTTTVHILVHNT